MPFHAAPLLNTVKCTCHSTWATLLQCIITMAQPSKPQTYDEDGDEIGCCDGGTCFDGVDALADSTHVKYFRVLGSLVIFFSILEFALGGSIFNFLSNVRLGTWWAGLLAIIAGVTALGSNNRGWATATCVLASISTIIALIAAAVEGANLTVFQNLTACASRGTSTKISFYGSHEEHKYAVMCLNDAGNEYVVNGCYCVAPQGRLCNQYSLSKFATSYSYGCGNILDNFTGYISASLAFSIIIGFICLALSIISCVVICCPRRSPLNREAKVITLTPLVGVSGSENTFWSHSRHNAQCRVHRSANASKGPRSEGAGLQNRLTHFLTWPLLCCCIIQPCHVMRSPMFTLSTIFCPYISNNFSLDVFQRTCLASCCEEKLLVGTLTFFEPVCYQHNICTTVEILDRNLQVIYQLSNILFHLPNWDATRDHFSDWSN